MTTTDAPRMNDYHPRINIDDGRVLASDGAMLADGDFQFEGAEALECRRPAGAMVAIRNRPGWFATEFALVGNARRDADGLWSVDRPVHSLAFQTTVPPFDQPLDIPASRCRAPVCRAVACASSCRPNIHTLPGWRWTGPSPRTRVARRCWAARAPWPSRLGRS